MSGYKKIKTNYLGNNNHMRSNSNSNRPSLNKTNKKDLISNRPKSSMSSIKRPKASPNTTNRSNDVSQTSNESNVNHSLNVQSNKSQSSDNVMTDNESDMNINEKINVNTPKQEMSIEQKQHQQQINQKFKASIKGIYEFTHVGFDGEKDKDNNQDSYFIKRNFAGNKDYLYLSLCDGHGVEGHFVFMKQTPTEKMSKFLQNISFLNDNFKRSIHTKITDAFLLTNRELIEETDINSFFSGSTCVSVIYTPERLICPNIGDSRAVLGRNINNEWRAIELPRDHKPTEPDEELRIREHNGRIQPFTDEDGEFVGSKRVWIQEDEVPGLAMSRSFGDRI